jgi:hypothetical protein
MNMQDLLSQFTGSSQSSQGSAQVGGNVLGNNFTGNNFTGNNAVSIGAGNSGIGSCPRAYPKKLSDMLNKRDEWLDALKA